MLIFIGIILLILIVYVAGLLIMVANRLNVLLGEIIIKIDNIDKTINQPSIKYFE